MGGRLKAALPYAVLLLGAAWLYRDAGHFAYSARPGELGPDFWPRAVLVLLMAVCAIEGARRVFPTGRAAASAEGAPGRPEPKAAHEEAGRNPLRLAAGIGLAVLYVPGMQVLGFFLATALFLALFMAVGRYRRAGVIATTSVLGSLAFVYVFMKIVYVSLPLGVGPFRHVSVWLLAVLGIH